MNIEIVVCGQNKNFLLKEGTWSFGRSEKCDFILMGENISREHFAIENLPQKVWIEDKRSRNGTFVNGQRVAKQELAISDEIKVGSVKLKLRSLKQNENIDSQEPNASVLYQKDHTKPTFSITNKQQDTLLMHEIGKIVQSNSKMYQILGDLLDIVLFHFQAKQGYIIIKPGANQSNSISLFRLENEEGKITQQVFLVSKTIIAKALKGTGTICVNTLTDEKLRANSSVIALNIKSILCVPIENHRHVIGAFYLSEGFFSEENLELLMAVGKQVGLSIDRLRREEEALCKGKKEWQATFDAVPDFVIIADDKGIIKRCNQATIHFFQSTYSDLLGKNIHQIFATYLDKNKNCFEFFHNKKYFEASSSFLLLDEVPCYVYIIRDITERKIWETKVQNTSKLTALGLFSTGIVHEIGNPLAFINARLQRMEKHQGAEFIKESINLLRLQVDRVSHILKSISSFAKPKIEQWRSFSIKETLEQTLELLSLDPRSNNIDIYLNVKSDFEILGSQEQIQQTCLNILINALEAMPEGGRVDIEVEDNNDRAMICICDNGPGILEQNQEEIFQPFFSTKDSEIRIGLGLYLSLNFIQAHGGQIKVQSKVGEGTTFLIFLPLQTLDGSQNELQNFNY